MQYRTFTALTGLMAALTTTTAAPVQKSPLEAVPVSVNDDPHFNFELDVLIGLAAYRGADLGEVMAAANVIQPSNMSSWNTTFYTLATHSQSVAENYTNVLSKQAAYFDAASYYRNADFYNHGNWSDPLINSYWDAQLECFNNAIATLPVPGERVTLKADGFEVIGIYYGQEALHKGPMTRRPTLLLGSGYDGAQEDSLHQIGFEALKQGWNVMTYEGPGQPTVRRQQNLGFRYDWEKVATPAVDYLASRPDVDMSKLTLMGISLGGYLAARAAAFEPRIKAIILDDGVLDVYAGFAAAFGPVIKYYEAGNRTYFDQLINTAVTFNESASTAARWGVQQGLWSFNTHSPSEYLDIAKNMTLTNLIDKITVPTWIGNPINDIFFPGQAVELAQKLGPKAHLQNFTIPEANHVQAPSYFASDMDIFNWLESVFGPTNSTQTWA